MNDTGESPLSDTAALANFGFLAGGGAMGDLLRSHDWQSTPLGEPPAWPQSLRAATSIMLNSRYPIALYWGPELALIYNDDWSPIPGSKHPWALGRPAREVWPEIWDTIGPLFEHVFTTGEGTWSEDQLLPMHRHGYTEECYFNFTFSPIRGEAGRVEGIFNAVVETTERVLGERRLETLSDLSAHALEARETLQACARAAKTLCRNAYDVPFALIYLCANDGLQAKLAAVANLPAGHAAAPETVDLRPASGPGSVWPLAEAGRTGRTIVMSDIGAKAGKIAAGPWPEHCVEALVLPLVRVGREPPLGFLVAGVNPRRRLDEAYHSFFELAAGHVSTAIASAEAYASERKRAEDLAQLDRAKTAFYSNVSHEFRTPLTLMLGPLEDALADAAALPRAQQLRLEVAQRNARRLLRLVNTLLEFSRIEAGRAQAAFTPTDLSGLTADLASNFRSACERAGLELAIDCLPLREPVYVDRGMWETIVLNLLSNAFKFTFEGRIAVALHAERDSVVLEVGDTGAGMPAEHLPRLFERFHRVEGARGRTSAGSGIGLALVRELVTLHGGTIEAASTLGRGTTFAVRLPLGQAHLPAELVRGAEGHAAVPERAADYVEEALGWLPDAQASGGSDRRAGPAAARIASATRAALAGGARVLLADDNADMRAYVTRLLENAGFEVRAVSDGLAALTAALERPPDIVLSDVMMPRLDGFELLRALRGDERTRGLPVMLLSARAGAEARVEGFESGADDYVVKPFNARELMSRVEVQLRLAAIRRESETRFKRIADAAPAMLWITDTAQACTYLSRSWYEFTGLAYGTGLGDGRLDALHPEDRALAARAIRDAAARREAFAVDCRLRRADGEYRWVIDAGRPIHGVDGAFEGHVGLVIEMHERRLMEDALREADQRKDEFIAMLGHELRNPLAAIRNATTLLEYIEHPQLGKVRAILDRQSAQMIKLVDGLLDVSRIARGKIDLALEPLDLRDVVDAVVHDRSDEADRLALRITARAPAEPVWVAADRARLTQIFDNILGNAVKFSDRGGTIDVEIDAGGADARVRVRDAGVGIAPELVEAIFEPFRQDQHDAARAAGGIGLGLALVRRLVALHGGTVTAQSAGKGRGATFTVGLPRVTAARGAAAPRGCEPAPSIAKRRVLLVEDNVDAAVILQAVLMLRGHSVRTAHDVTTGLAALREEGADVVLCDLGLPGASGYELAHAVRSDAAIAATPLVALTGYGQPSDRQRTADAGFDEHLTKPVDLAALDSTFERIARKHAKYGAGR